MMNLIWLPNALADLNEIYDYYMIFSQKNSSLHLQQHS